MQILSMRYSLTTHVKCNCIGRHHGAVHTYEYFTYDNKVNPYKIWNLPPGLDPLHYSANNVIRKVWGV